jgi:hypothetical protein
MKKTNKILAFAMYKPNEGKEDELNEILKSHLPVLKEYGLISDQAPYTVRSSDGTIIEIFEWKDEESKAIAHQHPAMRSLWGRMMGICTFPAMSDLPEGKKSFPGFSVLERE